MALNRQAEALKLAEEVIADIELSRLEAEKVLLKCSRLARLIDDETSLEWIGYELNGYNFTDEDRPLLAAMGRIVLDDPGKGYIVPLGTIEATIRAEEKRLESLRAPSLSGEWVNTALQSIHRQINSATSSLMAMSKVRSTVLGKLYSFATSTYHELAFGQAQEELFAIARQEIDGLLAPTSSSALSKVESIVERLHHGDEEAISQAMSTCRRLIDDFADAVYPAQSEPIVIDGQSIEVNKSKVLNRIDQYVRGSISSKSRQQRLRQVLRGIYDRVSTAVHNDVTSTEARYLFLETYIILGEVLSLRASGDSEPSAPEPQN